MPADGRKGVEATRELVAINLTVLPDALGPAGLAACSCGRTIRPAAQMARPKWLSA